MKATAHKKGRRAFMQKMSLSLFMLAAHSDIGASQGIARLLQNKKPVKAPLIHQVRLLTATPLGKMKEFYVQKLGLALLEEKTNEITFIVGQSLLTFQRVYGSQGEPWYHFAFNVPENKLRKALKWHLARGPLIPSPKRAQDPTYPVEVRHFPHWNSHSLFFWDPAGNLLEYIARHDLDNKASGDFSSSDLLNISEIGFVVDDQQQWAKKINQQLGLKVYPENSSFWWAMGDENGLLLCIPIDRLWGENTNSPKRFKIFPTEAIMNGKSEQCLTFDPFPYQVQHRQ